MVTRRSISGEASPRTARQPLSLPADDVRIIAVLPALNQAQDIGRLISKLKFHADEVVVVDDGSMDETAHVAEGAGACVLKHEAELGKEEALKTGIRAAQALGADLIILQADDGGALPTTARTMVAADTNHHR
jgi:glycosyltransferase involved in cell wall biosynthesis